MRFLPSSIKTALARLKRDIKDVRLTAFNQAKFDAAVAWMLRTRAGVVLLNVAAIEVLFVVKVLKKIKLWTATLLRIQRHQVVVQEPYDLMSALTLLPEAQEKPRVLLIVEASIPQCLHYRVKQKVEQLEQNNCYVEWHDWSDIPALKQALHHVDIVLFYRVPGYEPILELMRLAKSLRKLVVYDIDDLIFDRQALSDAFQQTTDQLNDKDLQGILTGADLYQLAIEESQYGIASTPVLQAQLAKIVQQKACFLLPNGLDRFIESLNVRPAIKSKPDRVRIFYGSGTKTHDADFAVIANALGRLMSKNEAVDLVIAGHLGLPESLLQYASRIQRLPLMNFASFLYCLKHADIAIAPLQTGIFADCKSEIKWLEAACFGVPAVVSQTERYAQVIEQGVTGFLAQSSDEWFEGLNTLVQSVAVRERVGKAAQAYALEHYGSQAMALEMNALLAGLQEHAISSSLMRSASQKKRLLFVNVLYPPQAIGGATTVMVQSIQGLLKAYANEFDIEVLSTEMSDSEPYTLREYEHEGIKVTLIRTPLHAQLESRERDEEIFKICQQWLPQNRPDVIHFHSMQRLTASPLEAAKLLGIPYVVSLHDAWWLSEHQFLLDSNDALVNLCQSDPIEAAVTSKNAGNAIQRANYLADQLRGAKTLLSVSGYQAALYQSNGFTTEVLRNGVSQKQISLTDQSDHVSEVSNDKLVIGYLGGVSAHKGYYFLRDIVTSGSFDRLSFKIVDLFKPQTYDDLQQWGDSPVQVVGKQLTHQIDDFYESIDVLIAPSIWPESFGLVTREAALQGVWVVAADAGGMAEDVVDGETGFVFPMGDVEECTKILKNLNKDAAHYMSAKPNVEKSQERIFSHEQHIDDLVLHYNALLRE